MGTTIKISDRMAEMIMDTVGPEHRVMGNTSTLVALMNRGLARYDRERSREMGSTTHFLTAQGVDLHTRLQRQPDAREFLKSVVDAAARKAGSARGPAPVVQPCDSVTQEGMSVHTCYLPSGHDRDHTNGIKIWPVKAEVTEYSVKIWYRSGAYEGAPHCPEDLARKIYADAAASAGVEFAELHGPSGKLVESKVPHVCNAAGDAPNSLGTERCDLPTGHAGRHYEGNTTWPNRTA